MSEFSNNVTLMSNFSQIQWLMVRGLKAPKHYDEENQRFLSPEKVFSLPYVNSSMLY